jgi:hypothetical protein
MAPKKKAKAVLEEPSASENALYAMTKKQLEAQFIKVMHEDFWEMNKHH